MKNIEKKRLKNLIYAVIVTILKFSSYSPTCWGRVIWKFWNFDV